MKVSIELADAIVQELARVESASPGSFLAREDLEQFIRVSGLSLPDDLSIPNLLDELVRLDWMEYEDPTIGKDSFWVTARGQNRASDSPKEGQNQTDNPEIISSPDDDLAPSERNERKNEDAEIHSVEDSTNWTGRHLVLTDAKVIAQLKTSAVQLRDRIQKTNFESDADRQDLNQLAEALVSVVEMAEPDLSIIERILAHPKFKIYKGLTVFVATIRGAIGI